ncbi:MAG: hypothetical protein ABI295_04850 [Xanthomarina sp.]
MLELLRAVAKTKCAVCAAKIWLPTFYVYGLLRVLARTFPNLHVGSQVKTGIVKSAGFFKRGQTKP